MTRARPGRARCRLLGDDRDLESSGRLRHLDGAEILVEGRPLVQRATQRSQHAGEVVGSDLLAVAGTRGSRDVLVHQRAAEVVDAGLQRLGRSGQTHLHPRHLDVVDGVEQALLVGEMSMILTSRTTPDFIQLSEFAPLSGLTKADVANTRTWLQMKKLIGKKAK